ncbi:MAG: glucose-1-phosphate adenylyltransferase [Chitinispirillales bacterium]|nr:glucose-1-phosphate adenylyltransferase [Chitinispirillales bacterium]
MGDSRVTSIILAGGQGKRLNPLTESRSKPAVPIGGKFRLIDIPISNCLHHNIRHIAVLTQFASESLHRHIFQTYRLDNFSQGFVSVLAANQTRDDKAGWYQGTADAVRQNLDNLKNASDTVLLLSGDHLYRMDFSKFISFHFENKADLTLSVVPVPRSQVNELGVLKMDPEYKVLDFVEKPKDENIIKDFEIPSSLRQSGKKGEEEKTHVGSMGIYLFKKQVLLSLLEKYDYDDFGKQIIPAAINDYNVYSYPFTGYWEDIGTIKAFFDAHIALTSDNPPFNFYDEEKPIYTHARHLPAAKVSGSSIDASIICEGCMIDNAVIADSVVGVRSVIRAGTKLSKVIFMGADYYEPPGTGNGKLGIGRNCRIRNAILDKDVRIGDDVQLINAQNIQNGEQDGITIRDGIIVVPKGMKVSSGYVL